MLPKLPKINLKRSLDSLRKEISSNEDILYTENAFKKVTLFALYINNRIENLLKKEVCKNAQIVNDYYRLNRMEPSFLNKYLSTDIKDWKQTDVDDINMMELCFKHKLEAELLDNSNMFTFLNINGSSLFSHNFGETELTKPDIKKAFEQLEVINKKITTYYKVHGYLKVLRLEQQNTVIYNIKSIFAISQNNLSEKHILGNCYQDELVE